MVARVLLTAFGNDFVIRRSCRMPDVDALSLFGLFAVTAMLLCYAFERRSPWFVLGFAAACALGSVYGFLQGAWPFGIVEGIWAVVALGRWRAQMTGYAAERR